MGCKIIGCGKALPERRVTNDELASLVDTSDEWIVSRTGIRERRIAVGETATDLGVTAARRALGAEEGGWRSDAAEAVDPASIDLIVCMTISGDTVVPSQAAMLKAALGLPSAVAFDLNAACAGCVYGMDVASQMLELSAAEQRAAAAEGRPPRRNPLRRALVVGTERLTRLVDWTDRATCVLFGDGAGAIVLEGTEGTGGVEDRGILASSLRSDGSHRDKLYVDGGPSTTGTVGHLRMEGREVFKHAVAMITDVVEDVFAKAGIAAGDLDWFVPHQANRRIIDASARKLGIEEKKVVVTVDLHGNTSAASVPLALAAGVERGQIKRGDLVLLEAMGGGFTWGAVLLRW